MDTNKSNNKLNISPIFELAHNKAKKHIEECFSGLKHFEWLRSDIVKPSYDDLSFIYKNNVYSVILEISDRGGKSFLPISNVNRQIYASQRYNMIPCKFPIILKDFNGNEQSLLLKNNNFNLYNTITNQEVDPKKVNNSSKKVLMSEWELRTKEIKFIIEYLKSENYTVESYQDTVENNPQIWFKDKDNKLSWIIIKSKNKSDSNIDISDLKREVINSCGEYNGYYAELQIRQTKLYRTTTPSFKLINFSKIYTKNKYVEVDNTNILKENIYELILKSIKLPNISDTKQTFVFPVFGYEGLLLRIPYILLHNLHLLRKDLVLIPFHYKTDILKNSHLGLPLYHIDISESKFAEQGYVAPKDVLFLNTEKSGIEIIKKIEGKPVSIKYKMFFDSMLGRTSDMDSYFQMTDLWEIYMSCGRETAVNVLNSLKNHIYTFDENVLCENSKRYEFVPTIDFYVGYTVFVKEFLFSLKLLAELPIKSYKKALDYIVAEKEFVFDFYNPSNIFVDWDNKEFNFIDLTFEEKYVVYVDASIKNQVLNFRNALFGVYSARPLHPEDLLFYEKDIEMFEQYAKIITDKINSCVPDEYKISDIRTH